MVFKRNNKLKSDEKKNKKKRLKSNHYYTVAQYVLYVVQYSLKNREMFHTEYPKPADVSHIDC